MPAVVAPVREICGHLRFLGQEVAFSISRDFREGAFGVTAFAAQDPLCLVCHASIVKSDS
jgi:hypothetical protein